MKFGEFPTEVVDRKAYDSAVEHLRTAGVLLPTLEQLADPSKIPAKVSARVAGVDISAPIGSSVVAAADGVVSMTHLGMFFTGKTIHIDHGLGIGTVYAHLHKINVKLGNFVKKGEVIGQVGKTGRVTGPHLHWGLSWKDMRLDPTSVLGKLPKRIVN